jgi:hypothetical protein
VTQLTRGKKPIHFQEHCALARDFAFQQIQECTHGGVRERARETAIADQAFHMEVFDCHDPTGFCDLGGQFVQPIQSHARNLVMRPAQLVFRLEPVFPALCASSQFFVESAQLL